MSEIESETPISCMPSCLAACAHEPWQAEGLENELKQQMRALETAADVRLGTVLRKRNIKPGDVVTQWTRSRGEPRGPNQRPLLAAAQLLQHTSTWPLSAAQSPWPSPADPNSSRLAPSTPSV